MPVLTQSEKSNYDIVSTEAIRNESGSANLNNSRITNLANPIEETDAVNAAQLISANELIDKILNRLSIIEETVKFKINLLKDGITTSSQLVDPSSGNATQSFVSIFSDLVLTSEDPILTNLISNPEIPFVVSPNGEEVVGNDYMLTVNIGNNTSITSMDVLANTVVISTVENLPIKDGNFDIPFSITQEQFDNASSGLAVVSIKIRANGIVFSNEIDMIVLGFRLSHKGKNISLNNGNGLTDNFDKKIITND